MLCTDFCQKRNCRDRNGPTYIRVMLVALAKTRKLDSVDNGRRNADAKKSRCELDVRIIRERECLVVDKKVGQEMLQVQWNGAFEDVAVRECRAEHSFFNSEISELQGCYLRNLNNSDLPQANPYSRTVMRLNGFGFIAKEKVHLTYRLSRFQPQGWPSHESCLQ